MKKLLRVLGLTALLMLGACGAHVVPSKKVVSSHWTLVDLNYSTFVPVFSLDLRGVTTDNRWHYLYFNTGCQMKIALNGTSYNGLVDLYTLSGCADPYGTEVSGSYHVAANNELSFLMNYVNGIYLSSPLIEIYR